MHDGTSVVIYGCMPTMMHCVINADTIDLTIAFCDKCRCAPVNFIMHASEISSLHEILAAFRKFFEKTLILCCAVTDLVLF